MTPSVYAQVMEQGFFYGYTSTTLFNICVQGGGGLMIAVVIKYAGGRGGGSGGGSLVVKVLPALPTVGPFRSHSLALLTLSFSCR